MTERCQPFDHLCVVHCRFLSVPIKEAQVNFFVGVVSVPLCVARFLDVRRRIAQERVPTKSNVGSRDASDPLIHASPTELLASRLLEFLAS